MCRHACGTLLSHSSHCCSVVRNPTLLRVLPALLLLRAQLSGGLRHYQHQMPHAAQRLSACRHLLLASALRLSLIPT